MLFKEAPMNKKTAILSILLSLMILGLFAGAQTAPQTQPQAKDEKIAPKVPRPIELNDILAWKSIRGTALAADGQWFAYLLSPQEGDGEMIVRQTKGTKEYKFPAGEARFGMIAFSDDSKFCAFMTYPTAKEAKQLRKERKTVESAAKANLLNLATGDKVEYDKIRSFAFSRDNAAWLALQKLAPEGQAREKEKWSGADLILRELATGKELTIGNVAEFAFDKKGRRLAMIIDAYGQTGNGVELRDMATGVISSLDNGKAAYKSLTWTEKGEALACLKGKEEKGFEDKFNSVIGFTGFVPAPGQPAPSGPQKFAYDPKDDKSFPKGMTISPNRAPQWTEDLDALTFGIFEPKKKEEGARGAAPGAPDAAAPAAPPAAAPAPEPDEDMPDLVLWHWQDKRLQSQQQVQASMDQNFSFLSEYRVKDKKFIRLADDDLRQVAPAPKQRFAIGQDTREYELDGSLIGLRYVDIYVVDMKTGARTLALKKSQNYYGPSTDGTHFLYYNDGQFYSYEMATGKSYNLTKDVPASFVNEDDDHNVVKPPDFQMGWTKDGQIVLLSDGWDIWTVPVHGGTKGVNLTGNGLKDQIRYQRRVILDPEEKGADLSQPQYVSVYGEWTKKAGFVRIEKGKAAPVPLLWDDAGFGALLKAKKAEIYLYTRSTAKDFPEYYAADAQLKNGVKLTEANPQQKDFFWSSGQMLLDYKMDAKSGLDRKLQAALFLPANYEKGKKYPTLVYYYEKMSQTLNVYSPPSSNGFNKSVYTSNGYAVLIPDITYKINDPGMSAVWCVLPALDAAVATGVVDRSKVALHGHSWGGYQTAFLVTQADFAAAVAGAPLTNMISMYSSIYFNSGSANQPIFESSQGRFKGGYWDNLDAYQRNSPVYYATKVKTPLIILHNDKDGAVVWNQGIEYYNTLRRLKKPVIMFQYVGENHGLAKAANQKDYTVRMKEFFDHYLKGAPAPKWLTDGIPYLKMKDDLKERVKAMKPKDEKPPIFSPRSPGPAS
jgi:dipeptidyl aminopeptidase/acylaminoacyl peptidase